MAMASNRLNRVEVSSSPVEVQYAESLKTIEAIAKFLLCVECDNLPTEKVFTLDCCTSKYCESCVEFSGGKQCVVCKKKRFPKDVKKDLFSTSILTEIPAVYEVLGGFKNLTCDIARANNCTKRRNTDSPDVTLPPASSKRTKLTSAVAALTKAETNVNEMALSKTGEDKLSVLFGSPAVLNASKNQPLVTNRRRKNSTSSSIGNSSILNSSIDSKDIEKRNEKGETALNVNEMALSSPVLFGSPAVLNAPKNQPLVTNRRRKNSTPSSIGNSSILNSSIGSKDIEKRNEKGETALHVACRGGYLDKVKSLVEEGANVEAQDYAGWTPLHELINGKGSEKVKMNILKFLHTNKCDVNAPGGPEEETPLHLSAQYGFDQIVELLLDLGASPNVRQSEGKLPKDLAFNEKVLRVLEGRTTSFTTSPSSYSNNTADASMTDEDPVVLQVMIKKAVIFFDFDVSRDTIESTKNILGLKISMNFTNKVTHIVHDLGKSNDDLLAPMSLRYLFGVAKGLWQVSYKWIERSIEELKCLSPTSFEIRGCSTVSRIPCLTRVNHEKGNPSLLDGFTFYLYKMCGYKSETNPRFKLSRGELVNLIEFAGGNLTNRFPDPNAIDPLDAPRRFHVQHSSQGVTFSLTTHIVLYDDQCYPPESKRFNMEHVKTLKSSWVVDCILKFALLDPEKYL